MKIESGTRDKISMHVDRKLIVRLRIFAVIFLILLGVAIFYSWQDSVNPLYVLVGVVAGSVLGWFVGRMYLIYWDKEMRKVISRLDRFGAIILVLYIAFALSRNWIFGYFAHGPTLVVLTMSIIAGTMLGRLFFNALGIRKVLNTEKILEDPEK